MNPEYFQQSYASLMPEQSHGESEVEGVSPTGKSFRFVSCVRYFFATSFEAPFPKNKLWSPLYVMVRKTYVFVYKFCIHASSLAAKKSQGLKKTVGFLEKAGKLQKRKFQSWVFQQSNLGRCKNPIGFLHKADAYAKTQLGFCMFPILTTK